MRTGNMVLLLALLIWTMTVPGMAASVEEGAALFAAADLGNNGKSCAACHPGGKGLPDLSGMDREDVAASVNACLVKALEGTPLPDDSEKLTSLVLFLQSLVADGGTP